MKSYGYSGYDSANEICGARLFTFGCSYTVYAYPTWADYLGVNFSKYYNYGRAGSSNTYIMNKLVEADNRYNFNSEDLVIVMLTGFGRFSYLNPNPHPDRHWVTNGDMYSYTAAHDDKTIKFFLKHMWTENFAVYQSWIACQVIKQLLLSKNVPHKFLMGIDNSGYLDGTALLDGNAKTKANQIYEMLDNKKTLDEWKKESVENNDSPFWKNINHRDGHPSHRAHYKFAKEYFSEYIRKKSNTLLEYWNKNFTDESQQAQGILYDTYRSQFDLSTREKNLF